MRISHDVRDYAKAHNVSDEQAIELGMKEKSAEFVASGSEVYSAEVHQAGAGVS
jgi:phosphomethylpyrimidine synthase